MDPNNGLCNWISASGNCDYTRMQNFGNYPTASNGFSSGWNGGGVFNSGGYVPGGYAPGVFNSGWGTTDISYTSNANGVSYSSHTNKPSKWMIGLTALAGVGVIAGSYFAGKQAKEAQEKQIAEQEAIRKQNMVWMQQQYEQQQMNNTMNMMMNMMPIMMMMAQMNKTAGGGTTPPTT